MTNLSSFEIASLISLVQGKIRESEDIVARYPKYAKDTHYDKILSAQRSLCDKLFEIYNINLELNK